MPSVRTAWLPVLALVPAALALRQEPRPAGEQGGGEEFFELDRLVAEAKEGDRAYTAFLDRPSLSMGIYRIPKGGHDGQTPHELDEVYHVLEGRARLSAGVEEHAVGPGSIVFVGRRVPHRFHDVEEDLTVLVLFSKAVPDEAEER